MKDYNFISDDRIHKTRFCKKGGLTKIFLIKREVGAKGGGGLEQFRILRGDLAKKRGVTFLRGCSYPGAHYELIHSRKIKKTRLNKPKTNQSSDITLQMNDIGSLVKV